MMKNKQKIIIIGKYDIVEALSTTYNDSVISDMANQLRKWI